MQDHFGCLHARHLAALAEEMRLALVEVYEVASFYAHFDIVMDGEPAPPPITVRVCDSLSCELAGAAQLLDRSAEPARRRGARRPGAVHGRLPSRPGRRDRPCAARARHGRQCRRGGRRGRDPPDDPGIISGSTPTAPTAAIACCNPAWPANARARTSSTPLEHSGLRGLGGAGFPTGRKWRLVRRSRRRGCLAVNADEGEPGTFKDRYYLETDPHRFLEGMLIAAWAVEAADIYIYLRDEYPQCRAILEREIAALEEAGLAPHTRIHLRRGAGAYICGEESAMLESIEGKRGLPRQRPPFPAQVGLFGRPTLCNNVETLYWVRDIVEKGRRLVHRPGPQRPQGAAQLLGLGAGARSRRQARARPGSPRAS